MKNKENIKKEAASFIKLNNRRRTVILLIAILAVLLAASLSVAIGFSWFSRSNSSADVDMEVTDFNATVVYSIDGTDPSLALNNILVTKSNFSKLKMSIKYTGKSDAYIRVKTEEIFRDKDKNALIVSDVTYGTSADWVYDENSGYFYYKKIAANNVTIPFVTSGVSIPTEKYAYESNDGFIPKIIIEQVQPDRFEEFFGTTQESVGVS